MNKKSMIWIGLIIVAIIVVVILFSPAKINPQEIYTTLSFVPAPYERMVALTLVFEEPLNSIDDLKILDTLFSEAAMPVTFFITPFDASAGEDKIYNQEPQFSFDASSLSDFKAEIATAPYVQVPLVGTTYAQQEFLIKKARDAYRKENITVKGIYPPGYQATFDTLLAAENAKFHYMVISGIDSPVHPDSPLGIKMNLLLLPLSTEPNWQNQRGTFVLSLNPYSLLQNPESTQLFLEELKRDTATSYVTLAQFNDIVREREAISASIVTNVRGFYTDISLQNLVNNTYVKLESPYLLSNVSTHNESLKSIHDDGFYYIPLESTHQSLRLYWKES